MKPERATSKGDKNKIVGLVNLISSITCIVSGCVMYFFSMPTYPSLLLMGVVCLVGWLLNRKGFSRISAVILVGVMLGTIQFNIFYGYGMHDVAIIAWPAIIFFVGLFFGSRAIPYITGFIMVLAVVTRLIPNANKFIGLNDSGDMVVMLLIIAGFSLIGMSIIRSNEHSERALRESENRYRDLYQNSSVGLYRTTPDGRFLLANSAMVTMLGFPSFEELSAKSLDAEGFVAGYERPLFIELIERNGEIKGLESSLTKKDGGTIFIRESATLTRDEHGRTLYYDGIIEDITERKHSEQLLQKSEQQFRQLIEMANEGILIAQGPQLKYVNPMILEITGFDRETLLSSPFLDFVHPDDRELMVGNYRKRIMGETIGQRYRIRIVTHGKGTKWVEMSGSKIEWGGQPAILNFVNDITERMFAEEDRIAREIAERGNRAKSEFISRMSHELRTPLNAILGFGQLLRMDELRPDQQRAVDHINTSGRHLLNLVNEVLDIAKMESGKMRLATEAIRLEGAVKEAIELIRPSAEVRNISLRFEMSCPDDLSVVADQRRLRQVLLNLLSNAVKYNREGGEITVTTSVTLDGHLRLQVRDSGEGIAPDKLERLFVPFDRLGMEAVEQDGTGLGLALSKGLMEAMGGSIGAESMFGEGSLFWLELKLVEA